MYPGKLATVETGVHVGDNVQVRACPATLVSDLLARLQVFAQGNHVINNTTSDTQ